MAETIEWGTPAARWVIATTVGGSGLAFLDATTVNVALPAIAADLDADVAGLQWTVNAYTLSLAALILLGGSLADRFGRRRVFVVGVVWFAATSLLCGLAPTLSLLVAGRILQGVGGALLTPASLAILQATFARADRSRAVGAWSGLSGIGAAVGPLLGGWLVDVASWRWIFLVNIPLALVVVAAAARHVPETREPSEVPGFDVAGAVLGAAGLGALTWALIAAGEQGVSTLVVTGVGAGVVALGAFVAVEHRSRHPMMPPGLFASRQFTAANLVTLAVYGGFGGVFFLLVVYLQQVGGFSPLAAGTALIPVTLLMLALSDRAGALAERIGPRLPMTAGPLVMAAGLLLMTTFGDAVSYTTRVLPAVAIFGLGLALTVAPLTATVLAAVADRYSGVASGVNSAISRGAALLTVAVLPAASGLTGDAFEQPAVFVGGFRVAMLISAGLVAVGGGLAALLISNDLRDGAPACPHSRVPRRSHCAVDGAPVQPQPAVARAGSDRVGA